MRQLSQSEGHIRRAQGDVSGDKTCKVPSGTFQDRTSGIGPGRAVDGDDQILPSRHIPAFRLGCRPQSEVLVLGHQPRASAASS